MVGFGVSLPGCSTGCLGVDFEYGNWANYRFYGQKDEVQNNWTVRAGAQYNPRKPNTPVTKYFKFVKYRAGFYYGSDYINTNKNRPEYGFTIGTGMPLTSLKRSSNIRRICCFKYRSWNLAIVVTNKPTFVKAGQVQYWHCP